MNFIEILDKIKSNNYFVEFKYDTEKTDVIVGALKEKKNPKGFNRFEFTIKDKKEQKIFVESIFK
ncbi:hypothetical protein HH195_12390 (plasmid) [Sarcina sp. JB2]|uniref:Uncharacterized protein n=1 Tax=Candidatus Sarcina troglodytae TaxID=2726954 RepID=A0ACD1BIU3_9CLOT|nr:hypothetical protein [Sarcina sp. JB2]QPJ86763.1 hypothetical protein HH195_12390 [Sarcina sp. JB2]